MSVVFSCLLIIPKGKVHHETLQQNPKNKYYTINLSLQVNTEAVVCILIRSDDVSFVFVDKRLFSRFVLVSFSHLSSFPSCLIVDASIDRSH